MIIKMVCASNDSFSKLYRPDPREMLVGVDGGMEAIIGLGLRADLAVGDFDSTSIEKVKYHSDQVKIFPKEKNYSDFELALFEVLNLKFEKILVYNALGGRQDHFYAVVNVLIKHADKKIEIIDEMNSIYVIRENTMIPKSKYRYCSLFALQEGTIITLRGFKYPLDNYHLKRYENLCLSNEILSEGFIEVNKKNLLVIETM